MRLGLTTFLALAALAAAPVAAAEDIRLSPGEAVTLRTVAGEPLAAAATERSRAEWGAHDLRSARELVDLNQNGGGIGTGDDSVALSGGDAPPIPAQTIRFKFFHIAGQHSLLVVDNGLDEALAYRARITVAGRTEPTDVCLVLPNRRGYEHWPYAIERISLSELRPLPWQEGDRVTCE
ncbi:MAG TPA: hypothetical protein VGX37_07890 [Allosphingosinicella sp.]|nr:hypothetical protein [Allosphingosinicella sp.]